MCALFVGGVWCSVSGSDETDQLLDLIAENEEKLVPGRVHDSSSGKCVYVCCVLQLC